MIHIDEINGVLDESSFGIDEIEIDVDPRDPTDDEADRMAREKLDQDERGTGGVPPPTATDTLDRLLTRFRRGECDVLLNAGDALEGFELEPGIITVIGAPPGCGKTTLGMQAMFDALRNQTALRAIVANAEMPLSVLLKRELARLSGVPNQALRFVDLTPAQLRAVEEAAKELRPLLSRVESLPLPFTIRNLVTQCSKRPPGLVIVDYLQKLADGRLDARQAVNAVMTGLRKIASEGWAVLAMSATTRTKGTYGSGHDSNALTMASMKESGEIEFNADSIYLIRDNGLVTKGNEGVHRIKLDHCKNRHGALSPIELAFDMTRFEFRKPESHNFAGDKGNPFATSDDNPFFDPHDASSDH